MNQFDITTIASRDYILGNTTTKEQIEFILEQIEDPFNSGGNNYFKKLKDMVPDKDTLDQVCLKFFSAIETTYSDIEFDLSEYSQHLTGIFTPVYKFFVKNINKLTMIFLKQYIFNNKNRKNLTADYMNLKMSNYPKEQFGKKEFYILISKLSAIIKDIADEDIKLSKFIEYIERDEACPVYIEGVKEILDKGLMYDHGVFGNIMQLFMSSDSYNGDMNQLEMIITQSLIVPYMKENGMENIRFSLLSPIDDINADVAGDDDDDDGAPVDNTTSNVGECY